MDIGSFVLTIDDGSEHLQLTEQEEWASSIQSGMTIVMSVVMTQGVYAWQEEYQCLFCKCRNNLKGNNGKSSIDWWVFYVWCVQLWGFYLWTLSRSCRRRFQVKTDREDIYSKTRSNETETARVANDERDLIQNIYLRQRQRVSAITGLQREYWLRSGHCELSGRA